MQTQTRAPETPEHRRKVAVPGHPGIYRKGARYIVTWRHRGRQRAKSCRTLTEAVRFKAQTATGDTQPTSREPFGSYAERWLDSYTGRTARGLGDTTRAAYADAVRRLAISFFGRVRLDEIDPPIIRDYISHLAAMGLAPASVRRYLAPVRALLASAYEDGAIRTNPTQGVRVIVADGRARKPKRLSPDETRALLAEIPVEFRDLAFLLASSGVRISEALAARWRDLGQDASGRPVLVVPKSKTAAGERVVSLSPETVRRLLRRRSESRFQAGPDPIFPNEFGGQLDPHNFRRRVFKPAARCAGVAWATPHVLRHSLASLMAERGYSPAQIATHLGHADGGVLALRTYVHPEAIDAPGWVDSALGAT